MSSAESHPTGGNWTMATLAFETRMPSEERFFAGLALAMAAVIVAGFSNNLFHGRSSFASPAVVHIHAVVFMTWVAIFTTQSLLVARGAMRLHRTLGWIAAFWPVPMVTMAFVIAVRAVRNGAVPPFILPQNFVIINPAMVLSFAGLTWAAVALRRRTDWHRRLHVCGMAAILGPGFGRLLPMPLLIPWSFEIAWGLGLLFPLAGALHDRWRRGSVHVAWWTGLSVLLGMMLASQLIARSPAGNAIYRTLTAGSAGAAISPRVYPAMPHG